MTHSSTPLSKAMLGSLSEDCLQPYLQFASHSLSGDLIFKPFWEVVLQLEGMGFKVITATADCASPNRRFFKLHSAAVQDPESADMLLMRGISISFPTLLIH